MKDILTAEEQELVRKARGWSTMDRDALLDIIRRLVALLQAPPPKQHDAYRAALKGETDG